MKKFALFLSLILCASAAHAKWHVAESDHFVIYADDSEDDVREFAENLEKYHSAMEYVTRREVGVPSPSNRVTIFVVGSQRDIRKLAGTKSRSLAGFYVPRAGASRAFVQDIKMRSGKPDFSAIILLHEYAHHYLISSSRFAMPKWMSEGAAEFFASASFERDGSLMIGRPANHRAAELVYADEVSVEELLDNELYQRNKGKGFDAFYVRSWLLYHYLVFSEDRQGQLGQYWQAVARGENSIDAAREIFGDLDALEKDLERYSKARRLTTFDLSADLLSTGTITVRRLPEGEAKAMDLRIRSQRGVNDEQAAEIVLAMREIAAKYPDDPGVLTALAEAEYDAGFDDSAIAAADKAIAIDPARKNAYVQKGFALFRKAEKSADEDAAYKAAMSPFAALNKLENDHPLPLIYFYRSYTMRGKEPSDQARHAIERAAELAPFDQGLWWDVALMQANEGKLALAAHSLRPLAHDPHNVGMAMRAKLLLSAFERGEEGTPFSPMSLSDMVRDMVETADTQDSDGEEDGGTDDSKPSDAG